MQLLSRGLNLTVNKLKREMHNYNRGKKKILHFHKCFKQYLKLLKCFMQKRLLYRAGIFCRLFTEEILYTICPYLSCNFLNALQYSCVKTTELTFILLDFYW